MKVKSQSCVRSPRSKPYTSVTAPISHLNSYILCNLSTNEIQDLFSGVFSESWGVTNLTKKNIDIYRNVCRGLDFEGIDEKCIMGFASKLINAIYPSGSLQRSKALIGLLLMKRTSFGKNKIRVLLRRIKNICGNKVKQEEAAAHIAKPPKIVVTEDDVVIKGIVSKPDLSTLQEESDSDINIFPPPSPRPGTNKEVVIAKRENDDSDNRTTITSSTETG